MEKHFHFDRNKTLQELDGEYWDEPTYDSHLVIRCHELRKKEVGIYTIEDLCIMIGQKIGLDYLIPLAIESLEDNIYSSGNYYCGDLLDTVMKVNNDFWINHPIYTRELEEILENNISNLVSILNSFRQRFI